MLKRLFIFFITIIFAFAPCTAYADDISAQSSIALDFTTHRVLFEKNAYAAMPMASTTKIMTCLLACESGKLDDVVTITAEMLDGAYGSLIYLVVGDRVTLLDLVKGAMLASGNDAANAIAVYLGDSIDGFVGLMNDRANKIGMTNTHFVTPSGLDQGDHHSTAYDMALLACSALENEELSSIFCQSSCDIIVSEKVQKLYNHNKLLSNDGFVGIKTGYTDSAGRCLVSAYDVGDSRIVVVTLNAPNDWQDHKKLVRLAKKEYIEYNDTKTIAIAVVGGVCDIIDCAINVSLIAVDDYKLQCFYYPFCYAPVRAGDVLGYAKVLCNDKLIKTVEITALKDVELWQITK